MNTLEINVILLLSPPTQHSLISDMFQIAFSESQSFIRKELAGTAVFSSYFIHNGGEFIRSTFIPHHTLWRDQDEQKLHLRALEGCCFGGKSKGTH